MRKTEHRRAKAINSGGIFFQQRVKSVVMDFLGGWTSRLPWKSNSPFVAGTRHLYTYSFRLNFNICNYHKKVPVLVLLVYLLMSTNRMSSYSNSYRRWTKTNSETTPMMDQDESYHLVLSSSPDDDKVLVANINATTYFGARHALETLSQLIAFDDNTSMMQLHTIL